MLQHEFGGGCTQTCTLQQSLFSRKRKEVVIGIVNGGACVSGIPVCDYFVIIDQAIHIRFVYFPVCKFYFPK